MALAQNATFKAKAPLVALPVTVSDKNGNPVDGLSEADFVLLDNGLPRTAHVDPSGIYRSNISLVVVIQTSGISKATLLKVRKTGSMIDGYITGEGGEVSILSADQSVNVVQEFTSDGNLVRDAFAGLKPAEGTAGHVLDGVEQGIRLLSKRPSDRRRLVLVISEPRDRGSKTKATDVLAEAQRENVTIYTVTYSAYITPFTTKASDLGPQWNAPFDPLAMVTETAHLAKQNIGTTLAGYTGGRHVGFSTLHGLEDDFASIGKEIHSQYLLTFTPPSDTAAGFHTISVSVRDQPKLTIRTRPGYWTENLDSASE
jgi:VWFA-related protein